jgi:hypothetical protein
MVSPEEAEKHFKNFGYKPGDIVNDIPVGPQSNEKLETLLKTAEGTDREGLKTELQQRRRVGTWLLETDDGHCIYGDGKGHFSAVPGHKFCHVAEFVENEHRTMTRMNGARMRPSSWV